MAYNLFEATLDGVAFSSLGAELILVDIIEHEAKMDTQTVPRGGDYGLMRTVNRRESLSVDLVFCARTQDVQRRAALLAKVTGWAVNGGALKINSRPGKILYVVMDTPPALKSSAKWTDEITLTLTAYDVPYWQSEAVTSVNCEAFYMSDVGEWGAGDAFDAGGQLGTKVSALINNVSTTTMSYLTVRAGETVFDFRGISIGPGEAVNIAYGSDGMLDVSHESSVEESLLPFRTADSSDDLIIIPGSGQAVSATSNVKFTALFTSRGLWL